MNLRSVARLHGGLWSLVGLHGGLWSLVGLHGGLWSLVGFPLECCPSACHARRRRQLATQFRLVDEATTSRRLHTLTELRYRLQHSRVLCGRTIGLQRGSGFLGNYQRINNQPHQMRNIN